jgi:DNA-binding transcriptional LysR family regulator
LRNGTLDVQVSVNSPQGSSHEDLIEEHLYDEEYVIHASAHHRMAKRRQLALADLAQERWALPSLDSGIVRLLTQAFGNLGLPSPRVVVETAYLPARYLLVAKSDLLTFGSRAVAEHTARHLGIVELRVKDFSGSRRIVMRYRKDAYLPPAAFRFIEMLKDVAGDAAKMNKLAGRSTRAGRRRA